MHQRQWNGCGPIRQYADQIEEFHLTEYIGTHVLYVVMVVLNCKPFRGTPIHEDRINHEYLDCDVGLVHLAGRAESGADWIWAGLVARDAREGDWNMNSGHFLATIPLSMFEKRTACRREIWDQHFLVHDVFS